MGIFFGSFVLVGFIFYMAFLSPHGPLLFSSSEPYGFFKLGTSSTQHLSSDKSTPTNHASSLYEAPSLPSDVLPLEQIKDIVATTRGFFARDYSLNLGWNNVSICGNMIRAELMIPK